MQGLAADAVAVAGATAATFTATAAEVGKTLTVAVTGTKAGLESVTLTSVATAKVVAADVVVSPITGSVPTIAGSAKVGQKLTANAGVWTSGVTLTYQWSAGGQAIAGATRSTLVLGAAQVGRTVTVTVTGVKAGSVSVVKTSRATVKVAQGSLLVKKVTVTGKAKVGKKLTAKTKAWGPGKVTLSYQWYVGSKKVKGKVGAKKTLTVKKAYRGKKVTVKVTGKKSGYVTVVKKSSVKKIHK